MAVRTRTRPTGKKPALRRGFFLPDALTGLAIVALLASLLAVGVNRQQRASARLAECRELNRLAERRLLDLQTGAPPATGPKDTLIQLRPVGEGPAVGGYVWAEAKAIRGGHTETVVGLVPASAMKEAGAP